MLALVWRAACCVALFLPTVLDAQAPARPVVQSYRATTVATDLLAAPAPASHGNSLQQHARSFLASRLVKGQSTATLRARGMGQRLAVPLLTAGNTAWKPVGPSHVVTPQFGSVTGRVTSVAVASWDASGNTVFLGATGGGVWKSSNAAATDPSTITWQPLTDELAAYSGVNTTSLSIGAVSVQPGNSVNGVVLAGTGDPNDVLDSYYGAGILRSGDGGGTWQLITQSQDAFSGGLTNYSFVGEAFSGFAWSTGNPGLVVGAVTSSYDAFVNNIADINTLNTSETGLYYSTDAGQSWHLSTIQDGSNQVIQSAQITIPKAFPGVAVTSVVWDAQRNSFYAAIQYHGYYQSQDGVTWTRLTNQPGVALRASNCPFDTQSNSCPIFRGVLSVQPVTGDLFALTVGPTPNMPSSLNQDQGLWRSVCNAGMNGSCATPEVQPWVQIPDAALDDANGDGTIPQGTYNLALSAVASATDTLLFAGTQDIFRCSLAAGCVWRNTTNTTSCVSARVAPAQHAIASLGAPAGGTLPLLYFGNDSGIWRSADGVDETGQTCSVTDATHYQNLNNGLGSLAEVSGMANSLSDPEVMLAGFGVNGSAASPASSLGVWIQLLSGEGGQTAIDPANGSNWYATLGPGVAIGQCTQGASCTTADFGIHPVIGAAETSNDQSLLTAPYALDFANTQNMLVGTCRVWRGPASGGSAWSTTNAISPMLDGNSQPSCSGNALIRSLASGGPNATPGAGSVNAAANTGSQLIYAGMAGQLDGGGAYVGGHVFATQTANTANGTAKWKDLALSPVAGEQSYNGVFNPYQFDVASLYVDPHDPTGDTVYAAIQGFGVPHLYLSTNGGTNWLNISKNLPDLPLNSVLVDPNNASVVYVASDGGVFVSPNVANCETIGGQCWNLMGTGLPLAPAVTLTATPASGGVLRVGTYGRGIWETPLLTSIPLTTMTLTPSALTFGSQEVQTSSSAQTVAVTNTGSGNLTLGTIVVTGDFLEQNNCPAALSPGAACQISVTFTPGTTGTRNGTMTVPGNISGGQESVSLSGTGTTQSAIVVLPNVVSFGGQQINTVSAAQQVTISNTSGSPVGLTSENVSGPFTITVNSCSGSLSANTGCTVAIAFQPTQTGAASGLLTVVSGQGTEQIGLNGTGENPPTDTLTPLSLVFPPTMENTASAPQSVTLTNSGGTPLTSLQVQATGDFTVVNGCGYSLNAQSACTLAVRYTPHSAGAETGDITVTDVLRSQIISLKGTGTAPATDTLSATSLVFPATLVGQSAPPQTVTLSNSGDSALTQLAIRVIGTGFGVSDNCGTTVAAHSSCLLTVTFRATVAGSATGQVDVADALRTQVISLSSSGESPTQDNLSPLTLNFGRQNIGTDSAPQTVILSNNGQGTLTAIGLKVSNPDYVFTTGCRASLSQGSSCGIRVVFNPSKSGSDQGTLSVTDAVRTQNVPLTGYGTLPNVTLGPAVINFGSVGVETSSPAQTLFLKNGSTGTLTGISLATQGPYSETNDCATNLAPGAGCSIAVVFNPNATGSQVGSVIMSATNASTVSSQLTGNGISFELLPTSATSVTVKSGTAASYSLELMPVSGSIGNASLSCSSVPPNSRCTVNPSIASLNGPTNIQVAVATGAGPAAQLRRAGVGSGSLARVKLQQWAFGSAILILPFWIRLRARTISITWRSCQGSSIHRGILMLLVVVIVAGVGACGKGGGPLGLTTQNPLPNNLLTPPGTYTFSVTAAAGGLQKSATLTVIVQ
ncbi:MAG TPA: choice-of-anchor D domain-containing protein [Acidobacteriaceae bacterium]|nr:choice-of-anchor D domain-containing protein [Acidobacteriaceae bacterium]